MAKPVPTHEALLDQTIAMVAHAGLEQISLRTIAAQAGCTTAVIFQRYQSKAGLLAASLEHALAEETAAHDVLLDQTSGLLGSHAAVSDFVASYVCIRAGQNVSRFWSEILFKSKQLPEAGTYLTRWHEMRNDFWQKALVEVAGDDMLAPMVLGYIVMEEVYAYPLAADIQYQLLMRETARALTRATFQPEVIRDRSPSVSAMLDTSPLPSATGEADALDMRQQLLGQAIKEIVENGIGTVNQRSLTDKAAVSSSMIAYHFKNMRSFVNEAVWRALVQGIPHELDPNRLDSAMPTSMAGWFDALDVHVRPSIGNAPAGFYTSFARITGQACLLADSRSSLMPLVQHLRALEGWGTYRVNQAIKPVGGIARDEAAAFGMWIKGEAVLREAGLRDSAGGAASIAAVARCIFPDGQQTGAARAALP